MRSTASTNASTTCHSLLIPSDVITHSSNSTSEDIAMYTHKPKAYEFIVLGSAFINYVYTYIADHSHWM